MYRIPSSEQEYFNVDTELQIQVPISISVLSTPLKPFHLITLIFSSTHSNTQRRISRSRSHHILRPQRCNLRLRYQTPRLPDCARTAHIRQLVADAIRDDVQVQGILLPFATMGSVGRKVPSVVLWLVHLSWKSKASEQGPNSAAAAVLPALPVEPVWWKLLLRWR
jgi:hypothetical protein